MKNRGGSSIQQPSGYKAFIPTNLPPNPFLKVEGALLQKLSRASLLLARLDGLAYTLPNHELFLSMYAKKEALLSAQIEGTEATFDNVLEFESGVSVANSQDVAEVVSYIKALHYGIERLKTVPLSVRLIKELHAIILSPERDVHKTPGEFRRSQNWIGSAGATLNNAAFVPPPADVAMRAMSELEKYMHSKSLLPELIDCALVHYQFETIHPFLDGNGRVGRLLITFFLYAKGVAERPLLYLSYYFKQNRQEYYDRLRMVSTTGDYEQWVNFFLDAVIATSEIAIATTKKILLLQEEDKKKLYDRESSISVLKLLDQFFVTPIMTSQMVAEKLQVTAPTANRFLAKLVELNILQEITGQKRDKRYRYARYIDILSEGAEPF